MAERRPGIGLLPLRLFLGGTFVFAGAQKLADAKFLTDTDPQSIAAQMVRFAQYSPLRPVLRALVTSHLARGAGIGIALAEVAVGLAVLAGFRIRCAAAAGIGLSLLFFLTVSWPTRPYYYGSDLVFAAAFTPLLLLGDGAMFSLDAVLQRKPAPVGRLVDRRTVLVGLAACWTTVSGVAALFGRGRPRTAPTAAPQPSPTLTGTPTTAPSQRPSRSRSLGPSAPASPSAAPAPSTSRSPSSGSPGPASSSPHPSPTPSRKPKGTDIGKADDVPVGGALAFQHGGKPGFCYRPAEDRFVAYTRICTHQGCTVNFQAAAGGIGGIGATPAEYACPCHGAKFNAETGQVAADSNQQGIGALASIAVRRDADGHLYAG